MQTPSFDNLSLNKVTKQYRVAIRENIKITPNGIDSEIIPTMQTIDKIINIIPSIIFDIILITTLHKRQISLGFLSPQTPYLGAFWDTIYSLLSYFSLSRFNSANSFCLIRSSCSFTNLAFSSAEKISFICLIKVSLGSLLQKSRN